MRRTSTILAMAIGLFGLFSVLPAQLFAQETGDIQAKLRANVVSKKGGKYIIDRFRICRLFRPKELGGGATGQFQVKSHAEAPIDVISRDNFVALLSEIAVNLRVSFAKGHIKGMTPQQALTALRCKLLDAPIGVADFEVEIRMNKDGIQLEVTETATAKMERQTQLWDSVFAQ